MTKQESYAELIELLKSVRSCILGDPLTRRNGSWLELEKDICAAINRAKGAS